MTTDTVTEFEACFDDFIQRFEVAYDIGFQALADYFDHPPGIAAARELEIGNARFIGADIYLLLTHRIFGTRVPRDESWPERRNQLVGQCDEPIADVFDTMHHGRLAAWEITAGDEGLVATPIDGRDDTGPRSIQAVTDADWEDLASEQIYAGYLVDIGAGEVINLARALSDEAVDKLRRAADRSAWGSGAGFRALDYAEDVLAILLAPDCFETEECRGRCFLDPVRCDIDTWRRNQLAMGLREAIQCEGFSSLHPREEPFVVREPTWDRPPLLTQLAAAFDDGIEVLKRDLFELRPAASRHSVYAVSASPHQMRYLFPDAKLIESFHLQHDGSIDHPRIHRRREYPLGATDISEEWFRQTGAHPEWSIQRTLEWTDGRLDADTRTELRRAVDHFRIAVRWTALLDLHNEHRSSWIGDINYEDLIFGFTNRLPRRVAKRRLDDFDEPACGIWSRAATALRKAGHLDDGKPLTVDRLPRHYSSWIHTSGIGAATDKHLQTTLFDFARTWPESEGLTWDDAVRRDRASSSISDGLDELDALF